MGILGDNETLNIFTDASIKSVQNETVGCAGAFCVEGNNKVEIEQDYQILRNATNNSSEIMAIKIGVDMALRNMHKYNVINLFSDSKICIYGLREWIFNWVNNIQNGIFYNSSNKEVSNQNTFKCIISNIINNNLHINFYHTKGHVNTNNMSSINNALKVFAESNNIQLSIGEIKDISDFNNYVDIFTGELLEPINVPVEKTYNNILKYKVDRQKVISIYNRLINN